MPPIEVHHLIIHCPSLGAVVPVATFSANPVSAACWFSVRKLDRTVFITCPSQMISCWLCSCGSSHSSGDITMTPPLHRNCPQTIRSECACKVVATELDHAQLFEQQNCHSFKLASEPKIQLPWRLCPAALHFTSTLCAWHQRFGNVVFVGKTPITQGWERQTLPLACMFSSFFTRHSGMATTFGLAAQVFPSWLYFIYARRSEHCALTSSVDNLFLPVGSSKLCRNCCWHEFAASSAFQPRPGLCQLHIVPLTMGARSVFLHKSVRGCVLA